MATGTSLALPYPTPTTSRSSPTTTSAVNEKRRPPLTTFATRLISTTRSWRSSPVAETVRSRAISRPRVAASEPQPALTGSVGEGLDASVVLVAAAVEHGAVDARRLRPLGDQLADAARLVHPAQGPQLRLGPARGRERAAGVVVDQLREDPARGAEHRDPRALGAAADLGADPAAALQAPRRLGQHGHARLPTFRATYSPS